MFDLCNNTTWPIGVCGGWNVEAKPGFCIIAKTSWQFDLSGNISPCRPALAINRQAICHQNQAGRLLAAADTVPFKTKAEITASGLLTPFGDVLKPQHLTVELIAQQQRWQKSLLWFGQRFWQKRLWRYRPSRAQARQPIMLDYAAAYGPCEENPIGCGLTANSALPAFEDLNQGSYSPGAPLSPACMAPKPLHWQTQSLNPYSYQSAAGDQQLSFVLQNTVQLRLSGFWPQAIELLLPITPFNIGINQQPASITCDSIHIDLTKKIIGLTWRNWFSFSIVNDEFFTITVNGLTEV